MDGAAFGHCMQNLFDRLNIVVEQLPIRKCHNHQQHIFDLKQWVMHAKLVLVHIFTVATTHAKSIGRTMNLNDWVSSPIVSNASIDGGCMFVIGLSIDNLLV